MTVTVLFPELFCEQLEALEVAFFSPFGAGVDPALVYQNVDRIEPGNFALEFVVMRTHQLMEFIDGDTFRMLTHQTEDRFDGTVLLGEFTTVRHDSSFRLRFSRVTWKGDT